MKLTYQSAHALAFRVTGQPAPTLKCHVVDGLELVANRHSKSWLFFYRTSTGMRRRPKLGEFPTMGIDAARQRAKELQEAVWRGEDPSGARIEKRVAPTVAELAEMFLDDVRADVKIGRRKALTLAMYERLSRLYVVPCLGRLKVSDVKRSDVATLLDRVGSDRPVQANRLRATLSGMFKLAELRELRPQQTSPVFGYREFPEYSRTRHATPEECVRIFRVLHSLSEQYPAHVAAILAILYAGSRVTELVTARRSQRRGNQIILREHKGQRKGKDRIIYLPRQVCDLIARLPTSGVDGPLFGADLDRASVRSVWLQTTKAAGCPDLQLRDLRRTFASAARSNGVSLSQIGGVLGHSDIATTEAYAYLFDEKTIEIVQNTADELERRMLPRPDNG